jgi:hypothetical protein
MPLQCPGHEDGAASSASGALVALLVGTAASVPALERMEQRQSVAKRCALPASRRKLSA